MNTQRAMTATAEQKADQHRAAGRRLARRLLLGRARPAARGRPARFRGDLRHQRRRHERGRAGRRLGARRRRRGAAEARTISGARWPQGPLQPGAAHAVGHALGQLVGREHAGLSLVRRHVAACFRPMSPIRSTSIRCAMWSRAEIDFDNVRACKAMKLFISATNVETGQLRVFETERDRRRRGDGVGLPAADFPGGRDRRHALLGRRLWRQSGDLPVLLGQRHRGRAAGPDQSGDSRGHAEDGQRDPEPHRRDHLQRRRCCANSAPSPSSRN